MKLKPTSWGHPLSTTSLLSTTEFWFPIPLESSWLVVVAVGPPTHTCCCNDTKESYYQSPCVLLCNVSEAQHTDEACACVVWAGRWSPRDGKASVLLTSNWAILIGKREGIKMGMEPSIPQSLCKVTTLQQQQHRYVKMKQAHITLVPSNINHCCPYVTVRKRWQLFSCLLFNSFFAKRSLHLSPDKLLRPRSPDSLGSA